MNGCLNGVAVLLLCSGALPLARGQTSCDVSTSVECAEASRVGTDVQSALRNANGTGLNGLVLKKAVLTLQTVSNGKTGINLNFLIFTIKHQTSKGNTVSQEITWGTLPKPAGGGNTNPASLTDILSQSVATAAKLTSNVQQLPLTQAVFKIQFVVDKDTSGSLSYKVLGVGLGPSIDLDKTSTNTLEVTFTK